MRPNTYIHSNVKCLAALMVRADLSIGAAGSTSWERALVGLPTVMICASDNQVAVVNTIESLIAGICINHRQGNITVDSIKAILVELANKPKSLKIMSQNCNFISDGSIIGGRKMTKSGDKACQRIGYHWRSTLCGFIVD